MAPLTRNKQAALQHTLPPSYTPRARKGSGQDDPLSRSHDSVLRRTGLQPRNQHHNDACGDIPVCPSSMASHLDYNSDSHAIDALRNQANVLQAANSSFQSQSPGSKSSAQEHHGTLQDSSSWVVLANDSAMTDEIYQDSNGPVSHHSSQFFPMQEAMPHEQEMNRTQQPSFIDSFQAMHHGGHHGVHVWKQEGIPLSPANSMEQNIPSEGGMHNFYQSFHTMGHAGRGLTDGMARLYNGADLDGTMINPFEAKRRLLSQASSFRSPSPSDRSASSSAPFCNISPHESVIMLRRGGDSSVDTSIDSVSNSIASRSTNLSRSSSTSDVLSIDTSSSSRRDVKGKTRLRNIDRKLICEAARDNPKIRQEDLAFRFGIERSTVSKTLKNKDKWLVIQEESDGAMIIKHRSGKFPELEATLAEWARHQLANGHAVLDMALRHRALEIARDAGVGVDSFKASVGWIEKFRDRHDLPKSRSASSALSSMRSDRVVAITKEPVPCSSTTQAASTKQNSVEWRSTFPPRDDTLRGHTSSSSISNEETGAPTTQETPRAVKRHYDEVFINHHASSAIESDMADLRMQRSEDDHLQSADQGMISPSFGTSKRRRAGRQALSLSNQQPTSTIDSTQSYPLSGQRKGAAAGPSQTSGAESATALRPSATSEGCIPAAYRHFSSDDSSEGNNQGPSEVTSFAQPSPVHIHEESEQETLPLNQSSISAYHENRQVTLQEARESLEIVLSFIARQPSYLSPNDYFVLGNLRGTLSALAAGPNQSQTQFQDQHQQHDQQQHQEQQQHHHHQQQIDFLAPVQLSTDDAESQQLYQDVERQQARRSYP